MAEIDADTDGDFTMSQQQEAEEEEGDVEWEEVEIVEEVIIDDGTEEQVLPSNEEEKYNDDYNPEDNIFGDANDAEFEDDDGFGDVDDAEFDDNDGGGWDDDDDAVDVDGDDGIMNAAKSNLFESSIPEITEKAIRSNCDEINMVPLFAAAPDLKSRSRVGATVAIRVENLVNITTEQLEVWGITPEYPYIALKVEFIGSVQSVSCCYLILNAPFLMLIVLQISSLNLDRFISTKPKCPECKLE